MPKLASIGTPFFEFRQNPVSHEWAIVAPSRSSRPDINKGTVVKCPFCPGNESRDFKELWRLGKGKARQKGWQIRVIPNKYPFAPVCELVINSASHQENFFTFSPTHVQKIFKVYRDRFRLYDRQGQVFIFQNHGLAAGESIPHSHTQIAVLPKNFILNIPMLSVEENVFKETKSFQAFAPCNSSWPYEVWISPKRRGFKFGDCNEEQLQELSSLFLKILKRLRKFQGEDYPYNFYIYPGLDWYLRIIPRKKQLGGFEVGSGIFINTADPEAVAKKLA